ncbi:MAG: hypothetical protein KKA07_15585 [Bacteroidetes bacterium]|nr:hypothetical protein [Bacteroidota bacterium]MBU1720485.1 hypothetical protein [Bacteroidota bacterium]
MSEEKNLLSSGEVVGIDGTIATHRTISGTMAQIGVVAVNYLNEKIQHSCFISEAKYKQNIEDVTDYLFSHEYSNKIISNPVLRAALQVREREVGLDDKFWDKFKIYHGPLIPFEMLANPGKAEMKILDVTVEILEKIIANKKCFSIVSRSQNDAYIRIGLSLNPGEYVQLKKSVGLEIIEDRTLLKDKDRWREDDFLKVNNFINQRAMKIKVGVIKISHRPYVFHAHEEIFDLAARLIYCDSLFQKEKGFPLLVDYADNLCSTYFKASDFNKIIEYLLAKEGEFLSEMSEETLRQK